MNIQNAIKQLALSGSEMYLSVCTVDAVDEKTRTIECTPINEGAQLLGVNLQADQSGDVGVVSFPAVGSYVVVGFLNPAVAVVVLTTEITKIMLKIGNTEATVEDNSVVLKTQKGSVTLTADNLKLDIDGTTLELKKGLSTWNGGSETTANASELQSQLNKCKARIDAIINALKSSAVAPQDGGATYKTNITTALSGLTSEDYSNIIDDKIKH
jgi:hypothetical protein|nr:MAG TPA: hypothetical protein [Caudoviricetes sp.]